VISRQRAVLLVCLDIDIALRDFIYVAIALLRL
jgi:hypothetical protein